jgi:diazepam-binding inhibitor (GABA receptor modulator, acyl-CoA-binding protein)
MNLQEAFQNAVAESKTLTVMPGNDMLLKLYSLFKQGTMGDAPDEGPANPFDFIGKAKHEAWKNLHGLAADNAMQQYIDTVAELKRG